MSEMTKRAKYWSYAVAYVSLGVGAGVSVAGNIADTHRIAADSGRAPDGLDIFIAGFWPAAVLLVIEMFVSRLWPRTWGPQAIRWVASIVFGFIAAYMSWIHLSDLLASRSQPETVALLGPLAIDGLAIMATALILAAHGQKADVSTPGLLAMLDTALDNLLAKPDTSAPVTDTSAYPDGTWTRMSHEPTPVPDLSGDSLWERLDRELDSPAPVSAVPVSPAAPRVKVDNIPDTARQLLQAWADTPADVRPTGPEVDRLLAGEFGKTPRTTRGWRTTLLD